MSINDRNCVIVNGKRWIDVTNQTTSKEVYSTKVIVACRGEKPKFTSNV